jgi:predicted transposase YdaD
MRTKQYLIYIGKNNLNMADGIRQEDLNYRYQIVDMHNIDYQTLIEQDTPDAMVLAILCDFKDKPERDVVRLLLKRLYELVSGEEAKFREYLYMMEVLSTNRNLKQIIKEEEKMLSQVKQSELPSYEIGWECGVKQGKEQGIEQGRKQGIEQGKEQGIEQGKEQGIEQGIEQGRKEKEIEMAINLLKSGVDQEIILSITKLTAQELSELALKN